MRAIVRGAVLLCLLLLAACESTPTEPTATPEPAATFTPESQRATAAPSVDATPFFGRTVPPSRLNATVRVIHAAAQAPAYDLHLQGVELARGLGFGLGTGLTHIIPGSYTLTARLRDTETPAASAAFELRAGVTTDIVIVPAEDGIAFVAADGPTEALDAGTSVARVVHALDGTDDIEIRLNGSQLPEPLAAGSVSAQFQFGQGDLAIEALNGGPLVDTTRRLRELTNMLLVIAGTAARPQLLVFESPTYSRYTLRVINASPEAREVDVYFDGALVAENLAPKTATEPTVYANAPASVSVYAAGADLQVSSPYLADYRVSPRPGSSSTLVIFGPVERLEAMWIEQDNSPVPPGMARITFAHVAPNVNAVRIGEGGDDLQSGRPIPYGTASSGMLFSEGALRLFMRDTGAEGAIVELHEDVPIGEGQSILYLVTGSDGSSDSGPVMFAQTVGVDPSLDAEGNRPQRSSFRVRYINAIGSQSTIQVMQDDEQISSALVFGEATPFEELQADSLQVTATTTAGATLIEQGFNLPRPGAYTIVIFGMPDDGFFAQLVSDENVSSQRFGRQAATVRMINVTRDPFVSYGVAIAQPVDNAVPTATPRPTIAPTPTSPDSPPVDIGLPRLPMGVPVMVPAVAGGQASSQSLGVPNGIVFVVTDDNEIAVALGALPFEPGTHTDIIAYQYRTAGSTSTIAFPLVYALP